MDGYITVSAKTLDDAITEALIQLGVTSDHLDYEVIEKGSAGFLGIGMKQAVIKARRKQEEPVEEPVVEEVEEKPVKKEVKEFKEEKKDFHKKEFHKKEHVKKDNFKKEAPKKEFVKKEVPKREVELAPVEDATKEACVKFVKDVLAAMDMNDVEVKAEIDEYGYSDWKTWTDTGFPAVSYKQSCKQNAGWLCQSKTRYRRLQKKKKTDIRKSCKEHCKQSKENKKICFS